MINENTEIRKLNPGQIYDLVRILDEHNGWETLMTVIPGDNATSLEMKSKYSVEDIRLIKHASEKQNRSCTEIFFEEWGTSGKKRPTVRLMYGLLVRAQLFRAADYVAVELLDEPPPERPKEGPARHITMTSPLILPQSTDSIFSFCNKNTVRCDDLEMSNENPCNLNFKYADEMSNFAERGETGMNAIQINKNELPQPENTVMNHLQYETIKTITNNFDQNYKLGSGAFGSVYRGKMNDKNVAVKVLNTYDSDSNLLEHFRNEVMILCQCSEHSNILPLLAISSDAVPCLVYEFMPNGSLEHRLACKLPKFPPIPWQKRISIAKDISEGLKYLHSTFKIIHRDIKSANVLLNSEDIAKIGDFGLVRKHKGFKTSSTSIVQGTSAYMAPEAFHGTISTKMDIFSFGVVLLELLTGLPAYSEEREDGEALVDYIADVVDSNDDFSRLLDEKAGAWQSEIWTEIYTLSKNCTDRIKKLRPDINEVNAIITSLVERVSKING